MLSRRVIPYYGLIRPSESLPVTYGFAAGSAAPKEIGLRWESRGSPIYSAGLGSRADSHTPVAPKSADDCYFLFGFSLHLPVKGSAITLVVSRLQSSLRADFALMLRPASWLALLSRTFTFELAPIGSPQISVEYDYVGKQSIPTTGLSPASPTALWAATPDPTPRSLPGPRCAARAGHTGSTSRHRPRTCNDCGMPWRAANASARSVMSTRALVLTNRKSEPVVSV